jgi:hypothetical protein
MYPLQDYCDYRGAEEDGHAPSKAAFQGDSTYEASCTAVRICSGHTDDNSNDHCRLWRSQETKSWQEVNFAIYAGRPKAGTACERLRSESERFHEMNDYSFKCTLSSVLTRLLGTLGVVPIDRFIANHGKDTPKVEQDHAICETMDESTRPL